MFLIVLEGRSIIKFASIMFYIGTALSICFNISSEVYDIFKTSFDHPTCFSDVHNVFSTSFNHRTCFFEVNDIFNTSYDHPTCLSEVPVCNLFLMSIIFLNFSLHMNRYLRGFALCHIPSCSSVAWPASTCFPPRWCGHALLGRRTGSSGSLSDAYNRGCRSCYRHPTAPTGQSFLVARIPAESAVGWQRIDEAQQPRIPPWCCSRHRRTATTMRLLAQRCARMESLLLS